MNPKHTPYLRGQVVEEEIDLTLIELSQATAAAPEQITLLVLEGVLQPHGQQPQDWRFGGAALRRARLALRLTHDLELNPAGVALVLDLLDEIAALEARLKRRSAY